MVNIEQYNIKPFGATPNRRQLEHYKIGKKAFFHFGVNTFTDLEWGDGTEAEKLFAPDRLNTDQWIRSIKQAGFKLAIITAKHHDGFCLWPSKYSDHTIKNSPYKNGNGDLIKEFTDSCRKYGIKTGLYISPWDRNSKYWGTPRYNDYYADQLKELMTEYGKIDEVWWDGAGSTEAVYDWGKWAFIIRENQPDAMIFGSLGAHQYLDLRWVGNENGYAGTTHYASISTEHILKETQMINVGEIGAAEYVPSETDVSIRPGWFYHKEQDKKVKSVAKLDKIWFESVGRNSVLLLNFPPNKHGLLCDTDVQNAVHSNRNIQRMLSVNYACGAQITADSVLCDKCSPENIVFNDDNLFYSAESNAHSCVIDIKLNEDTELNVFSLGELIEAGERIYSFKLEQIIDGAPTLIYSGTSVGYNKTDFIPKKKYRHLRLTVDGAMAHPVIRSLGLYYFTPEYYNETDTEPSIDLMTLKPAKLELSSDKKSADISFGGIYTIKKIVFTTASPSSASIHIFNGISFLPVKDTVSDNNITEVSFSENAPESFILRIIAQEPIDPSSVKIYS